MTRNVDLWKKQKRKKSIQIMIANYGRLQEIVRLRFFARDAATFLWRRLEYREVPLKMLVQFQNCCHVTTSENN